MKREVTLAEAAALLGVDRRTVHRRLTDHLRWAMSNGRRVRVVDLASVKAAALPHLREREEQSVIRRIEALEKRVGDLERRRDGSSRGG